MSPGNLLTEKIKAFTLGNRLIYNQLFPGLFQGDTSLGSLYFNKSYSISSSIADTFVKEDQE